MARRYLIDSVLYWAREYHIDGFRFDLTTFIQSADTYREAWHELASLINSPT